MQYGVAFPQGAIGTDPAAIRDFTQAVEGAGFDFLSVFEHVAGAHADRFVGRALDFASPPYLYDFEFHEPFALFAYLAGCTSRLEFTTSVLVLPQRQTALVAKQAAEVSLLSGGRLRLGVGVGWNFTEYELLNEDFHTRGLRQEEQITVLRKLWTEPLVTFKGRWHTLDRVGIAPRPARPIPIWIGSGTEDRLLRRIARLADGWMPMVSFAEAPAVLARLREYLRAEGRDVAAFGLAAGVSATRDGPAAWLSAAQGWQTLGATHLTLNGAAPGLSPMQSLERAIELKRVLESSPTER